MEITYPFAKVFTDSTNKLNIFFLHDAEHSTFQQIGEKQKFNQSVEQDSFLQEFQRVYNRMYSSYYRMDAWYSDCQTNKMTEEQFKAWTDIASKARQNYRQGIISGSELLEQIADIH